MQLQLGVWKGREGRSSVSLSWQWEELQHWGPPTSDNSVHEPSLAPFSWTGDMFTNAGGGKQGVKAQIGAYGLGREQQRRVELQVNLATPSYHGS